jgi:regulator of RNase E activity RraB
MKTSQLSKQAVDAFKAIYQDEFAEELSDDQALEMAIRLLRLFRLCGKDDLAQQKMLVAAAG